MKLQQLVGDLRDSLDADITAETVRNMPELVCVLANGERWRFARVFLDAGAALLYSPVTPAQGHASPVLRTALGKLGVPVITIGKGKSFISTILLNALSDREILLECELTAQARGGWEQLRGYASLRESIGFELELNEQLALGHNVNAPSYEALFTRVNAQTRTRT